MGGAANRKCLICSQEDKGESNNDVIKSLFGSDTYLKSKDDLKSQLSIFFLVKQVLGLPTTFLEELLKGHGSPSGWKIELCRPCSRLFGEAEFLWEKMRTLQKEFEKVSYEIKEVLVSSMSTKEGQRLLKSSEKLEAHRKAIMERSRSLQVPVVDTVRATFFLCLHEKTIDKDLESSGRQPAGILHLVPKNGNGTDICLDERGVPFLSLIDFEKKIKHLGTTIDSLSKRIDRGPEKKKNEEGRPEEASDDDDDIMILNENSESRAKSSSSKSTLTAKSTMSIVNGHVGQSVIDDHEDEEPLIRIVNTSSIMEADEDEEESTPHLLEIVKHDISDMDMETDSRSNDPLTPSNDKDDPDYEPCDDPTTTAKKDDNLPKPEERRSALKLLTIVPKRSGNIFKCSQCEVEFETRGGCQSHILKDHYGESRSFHCHICSAKYELLLQLSEHVGNRHGHVRTPYDDDFNPQTDFKAFKRPSISQDGPGPDSPSERKKEKRIPAMKIYCCPTPQCSEQFDYKSKLNKHMKTCPPQSECEAGLKCDLCDAKGIQFRALTMDILDIHFKNRHGVVLAAPEVVKLVVASSVKKAVTAKKRIHSPRNVQDTKKPSTMKCPDCDLTLPSASAIVEHLKNPPNKCPSCAKHFRFDFDLKRHLEQEHADRVSFQCPYCPKAFSMQTIFEKHIDNHQKFDIHECEVCHEKMTGFATLTSHMENHSPILGV